MISRVVAAGTTRIAVASSAPTAASAATAASAISAIRSESLLPLRSVKPAANQRGPKIAVATAAASAATAARISSGVPIASRLPNSSRSTLPCEPKTSLARITPSASAPARTSAVALSPPTERRRSNSVIKAAITSAAPNAPKIAEKPSPSASTSPGTAAVPTAWA